MNKQQAIQNKKTSRREKRPDTELKPRSKRSKDCGKLVNENKDEKEIRLAKRREVYKKRSKESKGKRREYLRKRQQECRQERESRLQGLR